MASARVVNGAWTQPRQQEMDWVRDDRRLQCGQEGNAYHRMSETEAHDKIRLELPRERQQVPAASSHQLKKKGKENRVLSTSWQHGQVRVHEMEATLL